MQDFSPNFHRFIEASKGEWSFYNSMYHIKCGVMQGFPALRKAVTTREKISYFFTCVDIANQPFT